MGNGRHIGRGALASARQLGRLGYAITQITVSMGAAVLVVTVTVLPAPVPTRPPDLELSADRTALIVGRTSVPTPDDAYVETAKNQYIAPTHPDEDIDYVAVTTPQEFWPLSALLFRIPGLVLGPPEVWGPGGPGWPDQPWWKLSGLFDLTVDRSLNAGVADLEQAMSQYGNDNLVIYGYQQGAAVANVVKRKLAEQYPEGTTAPDIDFVLGGDPNLPNGGFASRFFGLYIPILDLFYNGPAPTDTQFDTTVIVRQYDFEDFPLYPLNILADLNSILGAPYVNFNGFDVSLAPDPSASGAIRSEHGDTTYYFFPTSDLPLFGPLRSLGVPEPVIDVVEPFFRVLVELGYDRTIPLWEPAPARLLPALNPVKVAADLINATGEGINNALALVGAPPLLSHSKPVPTPKPGDVLLANESVNARLAPQVPPTETSPAKDDAETAEAEAVPPVRPEAEGESRQATSTQMPTQTDPAGEAGTGASGTPPGLAVSDLKPKPPKPVGDSATPRPVVRGSLGADQHRPKVSHPGNDHQRPPNLTVAEEATGGTPAASSSVGSSSTGDSSRSSADGDAGES